MLTAALLLPLPVRALDGLPDTGELEDSLPEAAREFLSGESAAAMPEDGVLDRILSAAWDALRSALGGACRTAGIMLTAAMLCALSETLDTGERAPRYILLAGVAAIGASAVSDFDSYMGLGLNALQTLSDYSRVLLPTLTAAAAASGAAASAAAKYAATALFMDILLSLARAVVMPAVCGYAALAVADAAVGNGALKTAKKLMKSVCTTLLTGLSLCFTGWLALTGVIAGAADSLTARVTKTAVSAALPVVGSILADAAGTLAAAVSALRNSIGVFGLLAVLCVCLAPFAALGARYLVYKLAAAVCACVSDKRLAELVDCLGTCFGMVLALTGTGALMLFVSIFSLIRTVL